MKQHDVKPFYFGVAVVSFGNGLFITIDSRSMYAVWGALFCFAASGLLVGLGLRARP